MKKPIPDAPKEAWDRYEKHKAATKRWYLSDQGRKNARKRAQRWRVNNPKAAIAASRKKTYGITAQDFQSILDSQNGRCAICQCTIDEAKEMHSQGFGVDHDHITGKNRGILCTTCNVGLGMLKDSTELLLAAVAYLEKFK